MNLVVCEVQTNDVVVGSARDQGNAVDGIEESLGVERDSRREALWYHAFIVRELSFDET